MRACRTACWAVGGQGSPLAVGTSAQSPSDQTLVIPSTRMVPSTLILPRALGTGRASTSGCGEEGIVETRVLVSITVPSESTARSPLADCRRALSRSSTPRLTSRRWAKIGGPAR